MQQGIGNFMRAVTLATKLQKNNSCTIILDKKIEKKKFKNLNLNFDYLYNNNYYCCIFFFFDDDEEIYYNFFFFFLIIFFFFFFFEEVPCKE